MLDVIKKRRSIRKYKLKLVEEEKLEAIFRAAMFSPSARHDRKWEFVVVTDREKIEKLGSMKLHSQHIKKAPLVIVICSPDWQYWVEDCSIVAENIYLEATNQGLGTCFTQVRDSVADDGSNPEEYVRKILGIPKNIRVLCMMPIGYPAESLAEHSEKEFENDKIHQNKW
ncbi:MAG TPA: nitroreductase family protein [Candidatus Bathyarchaeia archaeon]|nr:nitroreductase family protein [Candidatus Bathyarchaeia archaeon]